jgi:hypothetical protein
MGGEVISANADEDYRREDGGDVWIEQAEGEGELQSEVGWYAKESIEMTFGWQRSGRCSAQF